MRKLLFIISVAIFGSLLSTSCSSDDDAYSDDSTTETGNTESEIPEVSADFETNSQNIDIANAVVIKFADNNTVEVTNPYPETVSVTTDGGNVVVKSTTTATELNYVLSGQTTNGSLKIYSEYKFGLVLNGVSIISADGPAINIQSSKKTSVSLISETKNRLVDSTSYTENEAEDMKAALFSEGQLVFAGNGYLQIYGRYKHAIGSDDYVRVDGGNIEISSAVKDGIHVNDYFEMNGGVLTVSSSGDAIEAEAGYIAVTGGTIVLKTGNGDGIKTSYKGTDTSVTPYINISGGTLDITVAGQAAKGIKSKGDVNLSGGEINITTSGSAYYDSDEADTSSAAGIKADKNMVVSGNCVITINSSGSGGKGISVDGNLTFDGGNTRVTTTGEQYVYDKNNDTASKGIKSDGLLTVNSGTITIKTYTTEAEGLESKSTLTINGGLIEIEAYDDGINASDHIEITGGTIYAVSETNDAIDSNGTLTIGGGTVVAIGSAAPEAGFDCDNNTFKITGGTLVGLGGSTSTPTSSVSTQRSLVYGGGTYEVIHIESSAGDEVMTFKLPKTFTQTTLLFSSPGMTANTSYTLYTGGTITGGTNNYGLYTGAGYTKGTSVGTFTTSSVVTSIGSTGGGGGGFGGRHFSLEKDYH